MLLGTFTDFTHAHEVETPFKMGKPKLHQLINSPSMIADVNTLHQATQPPRATIPVSQVTLTRKIESSNEGKGP